MRGVGSDLDHGSSGKIIIMVKAILLFHFDIDGIRIAHVDMAVGAEARVNYSVASISGLAGNAAEVFPLDPFFHAPSGVL